MSSKEIIIQTTPATVRWAFRFLGIGLCGIFVAASACSASAAGEKDRSPKKVSRRTSDAARPDHPLFRAIKMARESRTALAKVRDFSATFRKMEIVKGRQHSHTMQMKFRKTPFSVYLLFQKPHAGQEVLYVKGRNKGNMLAHGGGVKRLAGTLSLPPNGARAMQEGRHPITRIGLFNMLDGVITQWENDVKYDTVKLTYYPNAKLYDPDKQLKPMECKVLVTTHTKRRRNVPFQVTRLYIDKKTNLPVRVEQYGFPIRRGGKPPLLEEYTYWNVRTNIGLKDIDFDPANPAYKF